MNLNRAMIIGNLTRDPEARTTPTGKSVVSFDVATNHSWTNSAGVKQDEVEYHHIVAWAKLADICRQYLGKGRKVYVEGRLKTREWVGNDGVKRTRTEIIADNMIMLDRGASNAGVAPSYTPSLPTVDAGVAPAVQPTNEEEIKVEDIPF
jgi:single-strand DNA-binding protein